MNVPKTLLLAALSAFGVLLVWGMSFPVSDMPMTGDVLAPPSADHWLGTNQMGQDVFLRALIAAPGTIAVGFAAGMITLVVALAYAFVAVMSPPLLGRVMMRCVDIMIALPNLVLAMLVASYLRPSPGMLLLLLVAFAWSSDVRVVAAVIQRERRRDSYRMARTFGAGAVYLIVRHLLPRMVPLLAALGVQGTRRAIMHASGLAFLGLTDPSVPTWGSMLAEAIPLLYDAAAVWLILTPIAALSAFLLLLSLAGARLEAWSHLSQGGTLDHG